MMLFVNYFCTEQHATGKIGQKEYFFLYIITIKYNYSQGKMNSNVNTLKLKQFWVDLSKKYYFDLCLWLIIKQNKGS